MERDKSLDGIKFILICSVILVHQRCLSECGNMNAVLNMFTMPMFIILSGYFTKVKTWENYFQWAKKMACLFLIFNFLHTLVNVFFYDEKWGNSFFMGFINPPFTMWYLVSLFWWRTMLQVLMGRKISPDIRLLMAVAIVLSLAVGFVPIGRPFSFQRTFAWLPFFLLGYIFRERDAISWIRRQAAWPFVVALVATVVVAWLLPTYIPKAAYKKGLYSMMERGEMMLDSFVLCVSLFRLIPVSFANRLSGLGALTMYFYLYHSPFIRIQRHYLGEYDIRLNLPEGLLLTVLYILVILLMSRVKLFRWLLMEK